MGEYLTQREEIELERSLALSSLNRALNILPQGNAIQATEQYQEERPFSQEFSAFWKSTLQAPTSGWTGPPRDPIHRAIDAELRRFRQVSLECFKLKLSIWPASNAPVNLHDGCSDIKFFHFADGFDVSHCVPVQLVEGVDGDLNILLRFNRRWRTFEHFLQLLCDRSVCPVPDPYGLQWQWWMQNGKSFNILGLPAEIRERIYCHTVRPSHPNPEYWKVKPCRYARRGWSDRGYVSSAIKPHLNILFTNRQVSYEAAYVLYKHTDFVFDEPRQLEQFFAKVGGNFENIRKIQLHFKHKGYLKFFGAHIATKYWWDRSFAASHLKNLNLQKLDIFLPSPQNMEDHHWLWDSGLEQGCQKKVIDWILRFARPYIQDLPFELHGCIKTSQKEQFMESIEADKVTRKTVREAREQAHKSKCVRREIESDDDEEDGGVPLEMDSGYGSTHSEISWNSEWDSEGDYERQFESLTEQLPPRCDCKTRCHIDDFTAED